MCGGTNSDAWLCEQARLTAPPPVVIKATARTAGGHGRTRIPFLRHEYILTLTGQLAAELSRRLPGEAPRIAADCADSNHTRNIDRKIEQFAHLYRGIDVIVPINSPAALSKKSISKSPDRTTSRPLARNGSHRRIGCSLNDAIQRRKASILVYDQNVTTPAIEELIAAANDTGMPAVGLRETAPRVLHSQQWLLRQLNAVHGGLIGPRHEQNRDDCHAAQLPRSARRRATDAHPHCFDRGPDPGALQRARPDCRRIQCLGFDDAFSAYAIQGYDSKGDGNPTRAGTAAVRRDQPEFPGRIRLLHADEGRGHESRFRESQRIFRRLRQ